MAHLGGEREHQQRDLDEARQQLAATTEILTAVGRSGSDVEDVLNIVVESACRLSHADIAQIHMIEGEEYRLATVRGHTPEYLEFVTRKPIKLNRETLIGRVGLDRRAQQIADVLADAQYGRKDIQERGGYRSILGVPMILEDELVGVLSAWRTEVRPFGERAIEVLTTFAAQAAIVIRNADLVVALEARQAELAASVEQLVALGEIGRAVSRSLDLDQVLQLIVTHAVELTDADGGSIFEFDDKDNEFHIMTASDTSDDLVDRLRQIRLPLHETVVLGRAALERRSVKIPDLRQVPRDAHLQTLLDGGWLSLVAVPILQDQQIVGALVIRRRTAGDFADDVGELLEAFAGQSAVAILNARLYSALADASRHKTEFVARMSHELRTPLNAVIGFSDVLLEGTFGEINDKQREYLGDILRSGRILLELVNDILDLSRIEADHLELNPTPFVVREVLENALRMISQRAMSREVKPTLDIGDGVETVEADEQYVRQVVNNLLSNAVKFTYRRIDVSATTDGATLTVTVADDGPGIVEEDRIRIFQPFQQSGRMPAHAEGVGLGLAICTRLVELHGGRIWVEPGVDVGSHFMFTIPVSQARTPPDEAPRPVPSSSSPLVVIVEDDPPSLELLSHHVRAAGVEVETAGDGGLGLDLIRRLQPAAVVLDIRLPVLDGWDLLRVLKLDPTTAAIPVVVVSMIDERGKGFAFGAAEYLVKPVSGDELRAALTRVAGLPGGGRTLICVGEDDAVIESVRAALEPGGWSVDGASTGEEGLELVRDRQPAVVFLDLLTTGPSGLAMVESLRNDRATVDVPIVVLTPQTMTSEDKERLRGHIDYVTRNGELDVTVLVDLVQRATRGRGAQDEGRS